MRLDMLPLGGQSHVHQGLRGVQPGEDGDQVGGVVVPSEGEVLGRASGGGGAGARSTRGGRHAPATRVGRNGGLPAYRGRKRGLKLC